MVWPSLIQLRVDMVVVTDDGFRAQGKRMDEQDSKRMRNGEEEKERVRGAVAHIVTCWPMWL